MKLVFFSDLHIHEWPEFGSKERLMDCVSVLTDIRLYCIKHGIKNMFFGGDLMHKRGVLWTLPYVMVANELVQFKEAGISFYAVHGNHDDEDKDGTIHALQPLMAGGLVRGIGPKGFRSVKVGAVVVTMFAYCESKELLAKRLRRVKQRVCVDRDHHIGLFHHGFKGASVGSSLEYVVKEPIDAKKLRLDRMFGLVLSGHYHTHQPIAGVRRGWYVGSPLEHTRSDRCAEPKGFLVVDAKSLSITRVALDRPRFVTINAAEHVAPEEVKGNFVDVVYSKANAQLDAVIQELRQYGARGINPVALPSAKAEVRQRLDVSPDLAPKKVLKRYMKHCRRDIKRQGLDRSTLMQIGLDLLREVER